MSRVGRTRARCRAGLTKAQTTAIALAADAELDGGQTMALLDAANFVLAPVEELFEAATEGPCTRPGSDPEDWFPLISTELGADPDDSLRIQERRLAQRLCAGCPVRRQCVARALGQPGQPIGIWGGLGARDLADLVPVWRMLRACLVAGTDTDADCASARTQRADKPDSTVWEVSG